MLSPDVLNESVKALTTSTPPEELKAVAEKGFDDFVSEISSKLEGLSPTQYTALAAYLGLKFEVFDPNQLIEAGHLHAATQWAQPVPPGDASSIMFAWDEAKEHVFGVAQYIDHLTLVSGRIGEAVLYEFGVAGAESRAITTPTLINTPDAIVEWVTNLTISSLRVNKPSWFAEDGSVIPELPETVSPYSSFYESHLERLRQQKEKREQKQKQDAKRRAEQQEVNRTGNEGWIKMLDHHGAKLPEALQVQDFEAAKAAFAQLEVSSIMGELDVAPDDEEYTPNMRTVGTEAGVKQWVLWKLNAEQPTWIRRDRTDVMWGFRHKPVKGKATSGISRDERTMRNRLTKLVEQFGAVAVQEQLAVVLVDFVEPAETDTPEVTAASDEASVVIEEPLVDVLMADEVTEVFISEPVSTETPPPAGAPDTPPPATTPPPAATPSAPPPAAAPQTPPPAQTAVPQTPPTAPPPAPPAGGAPATPPPPPPAGGPTAPPPPPSV
jgi:hypothetical protein